MNEDTHDDAADRDSNRGEQPPDSQKPDEQSKTSNGAANDIWNQVMDKFKELAPVVGEKLQVGAQSLARTVQRVAPVVGDKLGETAGTAARKAQALAPGIGENLSKGADVLMQKVREAAPVVDSKLKEGIHRTEERFDDLRKQAADRWAHRQSHKDSTPNSDESSEENQGSTGWDEPGKNSDAPESSGGPIE
jgi:hypothetical protein